MGNIAATAARQKVELFEPLLRRDEAEIVSFHQGASAPPAYAVRPRPSQDAGWTATSLFSGCGGLDLGFQFEGIRTDAAYDIDEAAVATYNANLHEAAMVRDLSAGLPGSSGETILLAGAPCQGFSTVGKRRFDDPRNDLLARVGDFALAHRPRVIVVENVPAALSGRHQIHWRTLEDRLRWHGYQVRRLALDGEKRGLAQRRRRLILLCWRGSDCIEPRFQDAPAIDLSAALTGVETLPDHVPVALRDDTVNAAIARRIGPGQKLSNVRSGPRNVPTWDIPEVFGATDTGDRELLSAVAKLRRRNRVRTFGDGDPVEQAVLDRELGRDTSGQVAKLAALRYLRITRDGIELQHTYNGKFRRLEWSGVSPTVDTHFGNPAKFLHPSGVRALTIREALRIQGFPDWFRLHGSKRAVYAMAGNAVPPPMAADLAAFVREAILKA